MHMWGERGLSIVDLRGHCKLLMWVHVSCFYCYGIMECCSERYKWTIQEYFIYTFPNHPNIFHQQQIPILPSTHNVFTAPFFQHVHSGCWTIRNASPVARCFPASGERIPGTFTPLHSTPKCAFYESLRAKKQRTTQKKAFGFMFEIFKPWQ